MFSVFPPTIASRCELGAESGIGNEESYPRIGVQISPSRESELAQLITDCLDAIVRLYML